MSDKYLKYKKKYLKLKKFVGGDHHSLEDAHRILQMSFINGSTYNTKYVTIKNAYDNLAENDKENFKVLFRNAIFDIIIEKNENPNELIDKKEELYRYLNKTRRYLNILDIELESKIEEYIEDHYWLNDVTNKVKNIIVASKRDLETYFITPR